VIDAVINKADEIEFMNVSSINAIQMGMRALDLMSYYTSRQGLSYAQKAYPDVTFRYIVGPKAHHSWIDKAFEFFEGYFNWVPISYSSN